MLPEFFSRLVLDGRWIHRSKKLSRFGGRLTVEILEQRVLLDTQPNGLPILHSLPGAHTAIYIDFEGYGSNTPYDEDSDPTTFSATEQAHITEAWRQMASYFSMFDTDVTTIRPTVPFAWELISNSISGGYSYVGVFPNSAPESFVQSDFARSRVSGMAHEIGHNFGLQHQSDYDLMGNKINEYSSGYDALHGPIMGVDYARNVHKWFLGHPSNSPSAVQADVNVIATNIRRFEPPGGDGLLPHTNGGTIDTAVPLSVDGAVQSAQGVIARLTDKDAYSFTTNGGIVTIDAVPPFPSGLAVKLEVYRGDGTLLASADGGATNDQHLTLNLPAGTYYVFISSHGDYGDLGQYSLSVRELPLGWQTQNVGSVGVAGSAGYDFNAGTFAVGGGGADIYGTSDAFRYTYQTLTGDGYVVARVASQGNTDGWAKAGVMIRDSLAANAKQGMIVATPANGVAFQYRTATGGSSFNINTPGPAAPVYLLLVRAGNTLTGYYGPDGVSWTQEGSVSISMGSAVYIGLAVTSHNNGTVSNVTFDNVFFSGTIGLPPGWGSRDVGSVGQTGNAGFDGVGTFYAGGAGADIGGTGDGFRYVYRTLAGDGDLLARVASQDYTDDAAKAGVMIRESLAGDARQAMMAVTPANGAVFEYRTDPGGNTFTTADPVQTAPLYVDIARSGTTVTGYYSTDLVTWTQAGSVDIAMGSTVYIGLAVTSHNNAVVGNATFDTVAATGLIGPLAGANNTLAIPDALSLSLGTGTGITLNWNAVGGSTGYAVERSGDDATWAQIGTTGAGVTTYNDNNPAGSHGYYYRVSALDSTGRSAPSAVANQVNRPSAPFNVTVTSWTTSQLIINWRDVSGDTGYRIERSLDGVNFSSVGTVATNVTSFTNSGLSVGTLYYYRVTAFSPLGDSPTSTVASGMTRAGPAPAPSPGPGPFRAASAGSAGPSQPTTAPSSRSEALLRTVWWPGYSALELASAPVPRQTTAWFTSQSVGEAIPVYLDSDLPTPAGIITADAFDLGTIADLDNVFGAMDNCRVNQTIRSHPCS